MSAEKNSSKIYAGEKKLRYVLISAGIIMTAALIFSVNTDLPHVFIITGAGMLISIFYKKPFPYSDRSVIYSIVTALTLAVLLDLVVPMEEERSAVLGSLLFSNISAPFLLYLAVLITYYESSGYTIGISACFCLIVCLLGGEISDGYLLKKSTSWLPMALERPFDFFIAAFTVEMVFILIGLHMTWPTKKNIKENTPWRKYVVYTVALSLVVVLSFTQFRLYRIFESDLRLLESFLIQYGRNRFGRSSKIIFDNNVNLNQTLKDDFTKDKDAIALRAVSDSPPGYLRGRSYTFYHRGSWTNREKTRPTRLKMKNYEGILAYTSFFVTEEEPAENAVHIYPARKFSSNVLLVPGGSDRIDIVADQLNCSKDGILTPDKWMKDGAYSTYLKEEDFKVAYPKAGKIDQSYLQVPENISEQLEAVLKKVLQGNKKNQYDTQIIAELVNYFQNNFKYSLDFENTSQVDPALHFLLNDKSGHCELFASSMALLLRQYGIPTRYVTGFICEEPHPSGKYYVARVGSAHAWLEARPKNLNKWIRVEPTPAPDVPQFQHKWGLFETWFDYIKQFFQQALADMRRGHFAKAVIAIFAGIFGFIWNLLWHPLRGVVFLIIVIIWYMYHRHRKRLLTPKKRILNLPKEIIALQNEFARIEKVITKYSGDKRPESDTFEEWLNTLPENKIKKPGKLKDLLRKYKELRFRQNIPDRNSITEFRQLCKNYIKS